jgi:CheY-like chemotaxis protein
VTTNQARVLVIDDEEPIRTNLRRILLLEGFAVTEAVNGVAALECLRHAAPDLVICDLQMPEVDGYAVLAALRAGPATAAVPFIMLTASAEQEEEQTALARGASAYMTKPFTVGGLLEVVRGLLPGG